MEKYRTFWPRFWAGLIDGLVLMPFGWVDKLLWKSQAMVGVYTIWALFYVCSGVAYSIYLHSRYGQTIGKYFCKVMVIDSSEISSISFKQAVLRDIFPVLVLPVSFYNLVSAYSDWVSTGAWEFTGLSIFLMSSAILWGIAELLTMLTNEKRRAVHDLIAGTVVIKVPNKSLQQTG